MFKQIAGFLFGKDAEIFDKKGEVHHDLGKNKWSSWKDRFKDEDYDWQKHKGRSDKPNAPAK